MDWCEWFGFGFDPFFDKPLQTAKEMQNLLVIEKKMEERASPLLRQMDKISFLCVVSGERGVGKSTFMYYSMSLVRKAGFLPVYVGLDYGNLEARTSTRPTYEIERSLMYELGAKILDELLNSKPEFFSENKNMLLTLARYLGLTYTEAEGFLPRGEPYKLDFSELKRYLFAILSLLKKANIPILFCVDNLDKLKIETLEQFFAGPSAQSFFDEFKKAGVSILIALSFEFLNLRKRKDSLKYLSHNVNIEPISPPQAAEAIAKRILYSKDPSPSNPFEEKAMFSIGFSKKGITREILSEARNLCIRAFEQRLAKIDDNFVNEGLSTFSESRTFYEILDKNEDLKPLALRLCELVAYSGMMPENVILAIEAIRKEGKMKAEPGLIKGLVDFGIIQPKENEKYILTIPMDNLLRLVSENSWTPKGFLNWLFSKDSIKLISNEIPGANARATLDKFGPIPGVEATTVEIMVAGVKETWYKQNLHKEAGRRLAEAKSGIGRVDALTWDSIDSTKVFKEIFNALTDFLIAFSDYYICCGTKKEVRLKSPRTSDLIENVVHYFQEEYTVSFKSFYRYTRFRASINGLARSGFNPSHSDVREAFDDFVSIVEEFGTIWQSISHSFSKLEVADQEHDLLLKDVKELAGFLGYFVDRPDCRRFPIDGERYFRLGFSKFPIDEASIDVVMERPIKNRFGQTSSYFFLASVAPDSSKRAGDSTVLSFISKCSDLVDILKVKYHDQPQGWPKYLFLYVSPSGFEPGISPALRSVILPDWAYLKTVDRVGLKNITRQVKPTKQVSTEPHALHDRDELLAKGIEDLLRLNYYTAEIVQDKFQKVVTVVLVDMKDFTHRTEEDSFEAATAVQRMSDVLTSNIEQFGGRGENVEGDSYVATFERPEQALHGVLNAVNQLAEYNNKVENKKQIHIHIGMCSGEVIFKNSRPFVGNATNIAARISKLGKDDDVLISEEIYKEINCYREFEFQGLGSHPLKGIDKPRQVYRVELKQERKNNELML